MIQTGVSKTWNDFERKLQFHDNEFLEQEAVLAGELVRHWGMVAGINDGEDTAGRTRIRLQTPTELVGRAFDTAKLFFETARAKGLIHTGPELSELNETKEQSDSTVKQIAENIFPN